MTVSALIRIPIACLLVATNTLLHGLTLLALAVPKLLLPLAGPRRWLSAALIAIAENWIAVNSAMIRLLTPTRIELRGGESLRRAGWYLVLPNHQSWVDIPVLQYVFNRRIPFLKFFLKQQLIWVPLLGLTWWALDFPFMRRYPQALLARRPELRGRDKAVTRRACERFRELPVSIVNFVEGTRNAPEKHRAQGSEYRHLLRPKAGGVAFVLEAMGDQLRALIDVTIAYPGGVPSVLDLFAGRVQRIIVDVHEQPIPTDLLGGDYDNDAEFRARFQQWLNGLWADKDARLDRLLAEPDH